MATPATANGGLEWEEFRALEYFAILYDIAIDEEQYNRDWCKIKLKETTDKKHIEKVPGFKQESDKPWSLERFIVLPSEDLRPGDLDPGVVETLYLDTAQSPLSRGGRWSIPRELGQRVDRAWCIPECGPVAPFWRKLLVAKCLRAMLQEDCGTPAQEALDQLGLALLRALPAPKAEFGRHEDIELQLFLLRALFLNEASQCYKDARSIAFSDDCLGLIKHELARLGFGDDGEGWTPYELVALYNKAQGYLHLKQHERALDEFKEVAIKGFEEGSPKNHYIDQPSESPLGWRLQDLELFTAYLRWPATLQQADVLLNLQRSGEAGKVLDAISGTDLTSYQESRLDVLQRRVKLDTIDPDAESAVDRPPWAGNNSGQRNLTIQRLSVLTQVAVTELQRLARQAKRAKPKAEGAKTENDEVTLIAEQTVAQLRSLSESVAGRLRLANGERSETDQAIHDWVEGFSCCASAVDCVTQLRVGSEGILGAVGEHVDLLMPSPWGSGVRVLTVAEELTLDTEYRDYQFSTRKGLVHNSWKLYRALEKIPVTMGADRLLSSLREDNTRLLTRLKEGADGDSRLRSPDYEQHWRDQLMVIYSGGHLPRVKDALGSEGHSWPAEPPNELFHRFLNRSFVGCGEKPCKRDSPPHFQCFEEDGACEPRCRSAERKIEARADFTKRDGKWRHYLDRVQSRNEELFDQRLFCFGDHPTPSGWGLSVLQRWNSYTPALTASEGGGYFLFRYDRNDKAIDEGLVVDPGYGFLRNFLAEGFGVCDISAIAVTHNHPDHLADFQSILNLLIEAQKDRFGEAQKNPFGTAPRRRTARRVEALLSGGAFEYLLPAVENARRVFKDTRELVVDDPAVDLGACLKVMACKAIHKDASDRDDRPGFDSIGLILEVTDEANKPVSRIGMPSDTKWDEEVAAAFTGDKGKPCDVVCLHVGSMLRTALKMSLPEYFSRRMTDEVLRDGWHLYLPGTVWFLSQFADAVKKHKLDSVLVVLSEFGEEMRGGLRAVLAGHLQKFAREDRGANNISVIPGDVGLVIDPVCKSWQCSCCRHFYPWSTWGNGDRAGDESLLEVFGDAEQIFYVCPSCRDALSPYQRAALFADRQVPVYRRLALNAR